MDVVTLMMAINAAKSVPGTAGAAAAAAAAAAAQSAAAAAAHNYGISISGERLTVTAPTQGA